MNAWVLAIVLQPCNPSYYSKFPDLPIEIHLAWRDKIYKCFFASLLPSLGVFIFNGVSASCPRDLEVLRTIIVAALSLSLFRSSIAASVGVTTLVRPRFRDGLQVEVCDGVKVVVLGPRFSSSDLHHILALNCCSYSSTQSFQSISLFQIESDVIFVSVSFLSLSASVLQITAYQYLPNNQVFPSSSMIPRRRCLQDCPAVTWHEQLTMCYIKEFRNFGQECSLVLLSWGPTTLVFLQSMPFPE